MGPSYTGVRQSLDANPKRIYTADNQRKPGEDNKPQDSRTLESACAHLLSVRLEPCDHGRLLWYPTLLDGDHFLLLHKATTLIANASSYRDI